jgi:acyl-CoA synthetase (NDP forming)
LKQLNFVHPKYTELFDHRTVPSLRDLDGPVDLAFIMVGPNRVDAVLEDAAAAGIKNAVVLAAGYAEGGAAGQARQRALARKAVDLDLTVMGPNTIGFINAVDGIAPWAVVSHRRPLVGPVGAVFESGSMARATYEFALAHGVGSSLWASVGNSAVVTSLDILEYLIEDHATRSIALFLETVREPDRLFALGLRALEAGKPVVAFKAGRSEEGMRSAMAHTGAVATDDAVVDAAFRQAGIVRVESIEELVSTAGLLGYTRRFPRGRRMGVVTSSGGGCNIIADLASNNDLSLPAWDERTVERLSAQLPDFASVLNPLDTTGFGHARARPRSTKAEDDLMEIAVADPGIDFMYSMMTPLPPVRPQQPAWIEERMSIIAGIVRDAPVPVFLSSNTCLDLPEYPQSLLHDNDLFLLPGADLAMRSIGHLVRWVHQRDALQDREPIPTSHNIDVTGLPGATVWDEAEGRELLTRAGVPVAPARLVSSAEDAATAVDGLEGPAAMKICSRDVIHKSDMGGVILNVRGPVDAAASYERILASVRELVPDAEVSGVLVAPMRPPGQELLVGVTMDPTFGPVLAVGLGGIWVETLRDVSLRVLPVSPADIVAMLHELKAFSVLSGARGTEPVDLDALARVILDISRAALALGDELEALEVNPLRVIVDGVEALDVLVTTRPHQVAS